MNPMNGRSSSSNSSSSYSRNSSSSSSTYQNVPMSTIGLPDGTAGSLLSLQQHFREQQQEQQMLQARLNWQVICTTLRHLIALLGSLHLIMHLHPPPMF
jgi:hypothetical protein